MICVELRICRHLLAQSSYVSYGQTREWGYHVGKYASTFLALAHTIYHGVHDRKSFRKNTSLALWPNTLARRYSVFYNTIIYHKISVS